MKTMKKALAMTALAAAMIPAANAVEVSGNVTLATDSKFRGYSQTDTSPAVQGGFDVGFDSGFYVGMWGSNVDFAKSLELDYYAGYAGEINDSVSYDVGYIYYDYPGTPDEDDYEEFYASISVSDFTFGLAYSDDYYFETGEFYYVYADYSFDLGGGYGLGLHYGFNSFDRDSNNADPGDNVFLADGDDYADYSISLTKEWVGLEFGLSYVDTDIDSKESGVADSVTDGSFIFSISKSL